MAVDVIRKALSTPLRTNEGVVLTVELLVPASTAQIQALERDFGVLPRQLRELFQLSNGLSFFGVQVLSTDEVLLTEDGELVFHNWGTGDVTALRPKDGTVVYRGHPPFDSVVVASSLEQWFLIVMEEIEKLGALWHPNDALAHGLHTMYWPGQ